MSAEDDLTRYIRDFDRIFNEIDSKERRERELELEEKRRTRRQRLERIEALHPQLRDLGTVAGMTLFEAWLWADSIIREGKDYLANREGWKL